MRAYAAGIDDFFFIQVGANDGRIGDPIYELVTELGWRGVLVEPQKKVFEQSLLKTYAGYEGLVFENVAIADVAGQKTLYTLSFCDERWATGIASFQRGHLEKHIRQGYIEQCLRGRALELPPSRDDYIAATPVECITFGDLIRKHAIERVNLLQIDVEGYDFELLKTYDFSTIKPDVIHYERWHLSETDRSDCARMLEGHGYQVFQDGMNCVALLKGVIE